MDAYWRQTPRLLAEWIAARVRAAEHVFKRQAWHTWHAARLTALAVNSPKDLPSLAAFRGDKPAVRAPQSADELLSIAMRWEAVGVGQVTRH